MHILIFCSLVYCCLGIAESLNGNDLCDRPCINGDLQTCEYEFKLEWYSTMSSACYDCPSVRSDCDRPECIVADGVRRPVIVSNRMLPGQPIKVCQNDIVIVRVSNEMSDGEGATIHWHGIDHNGTERTPYMDGANLVTQCPIPMSGGFVYDFPADPAGTHFWHSHVGLQRADGLQGPLIVREHKSREPHYDLYDHDCDTPSGDCEHVVFLSDWSNTLANIRYIENIFSLTPVGNTSALMNGKTNIANLQEPLPAGQTFWEVFNVVPGKSYRFRVISGASGLCPFKVAVDGHNMTLIAADGQPVKQRRIDTFVIANGERIDFILDSNQAVDNYWLQAWGTKGCEGKDVFGIIRYDGAPQDEPRADRTVDRTGILFNPVNSTGKHETSFGKNDILIHELSSTKTQDPLPDMTTDRRIIVGMDTQKFPSQNLPEEKLPFKPHFNNRDEIDDKNKCNRDSVDGQKCDEEGCICTNIVEVELGQVVELFLINEAINVKTGHPIHLHGNKFGVLSSGMLGNSTFVDEVIDKWESGDLPVNKAPGYIDTVWVPEGGYVIAKFKADNPGIWFLHCHIDVHLEEGMAMLIQVGNHTDFPEVPEHFPRCGFWPERQANSTGTWPTAPKVMVPVMGVILVILVIALIWTCCRK